MEEYINKIRKLNLKFIALILIFALTPSVSAGAILLYEEESKSKIILIDPGHGGYDGGAVSKNGTVEKDINLSIALKLKKRLEDQGHKVYMTREEDESLNSITKKPSSKKVEDLNNRCRMKKEVNCDMFISIHQNTFPQSKVFGAQVWYSKFEESKILASKIQSSLREIVDTKNTRIEKPALDHYRILRDGYEAPSVLVECGFITNAEEERKLKNEEYQNKIAEAIAEGVKRYYEEIGKANSVE
ncbi:N-acetylmuramoyl-L-alanine amidase CwlD [Clostridium polynesiense]|uniref:N-acetylmuramoyl-L-alanine amidase CwlD n=1 Tax=Clostridium polynesiense TaxID=1325933 RepID=UPI0006939390|nr:N-acetylmuramoyl-L-alanine amidase CwlD [Clostridium polynesiense]